MHACIMHYMQQTSFRVIQKKSFWSYNSQLILASKKVIDYSYFLLLDYISLKGNKLVCFVNSDGSLKVRYGTWFLKVVQGEGFLVGSYMHQKPQQGAGKIAQNNF